MTINDTFSLEDRILCSDDSCVGIIGDDGLCGQCGLPGGNGDVPPASEASPFDHVSEDREEALDTSSAPPLPGTDEDERVPCSDGTCVGILGADGVCGTCGLAGTA